ncbi:MAG: gamma-glutamylcyclotransferase [Planctomycetota bacterium]|nr:MAG: gamma-glutamylcyclotransferase [Planctomycetota bacterium]
MDLMKYFAYGSNCNPAILANKRVEFKSRARGTLRGYRMRFNKKALRERLPEGIGFANIEADPDGVVEGIVYDVVDEHVCRLDESERYPDHYTRITITVETPSGFEECQAYQAQPDKVAGGLVPSRNYLNHILAAHDFLSKQYYQALDQSQTYTGECACCDYRGEVLFLIENERTHTLCQPCREAKGIWGDTRGRKLTVAEAQAVTAFITDSGKAFHSIQSLIEAAVKQRVIDP